MMRKCFTTQTRCLTAWQRLEEQLAEGREISIISLSGTWHSVLLCDRRMRPATPVYPWSYTGAAPLCGRLREDAGFVEDYYQKTGCMVNATYPFFKLLFFSGSKDMI